MKKSILFAGVIALVAIAAASCKSKEEGPKALFTYEPEGLTVTFTNASKDAESYVWEFGDGETSEEANPKHTYKAYGAYTVKLTAKSAAGSNTYEEVITLEMKAINADGKFDDWEAMPEENYAHCKASDKDVYSGLFDAKFARDNDYIYFYLEFDGTKDIFQQKIYDDTWTEIIDIKDVEGHLVEYLDFYLNCGDETTGGYSEWLWSEAAADVCVEGTWTDKFEGASVHTWPTDKNLVDDWLWVQSTVMGATECCEAVKLENGHMAIEGKITVALLPVKPVETLKIGVLAQDAGWNESGILPATVEIGGVPTYSPLIEVPLIK